MTQLYFNDVCGSLGSYYPGPEDCSVTSTASDKEVIEKFEQLMRVDEYLGCEGAGCVNITLHRDGKLIYEKKATAKPEGDCKFHLSTEFKEFQ